MNLWLSLLEATRQFGLPFPFEILHLARSSIRTIVSPSHWTLSPETASPVHRHYLPRSAARRAAHNMATTSTVFHRCITSPNWWPGRMVRRKTLRRASWELGAHLQDLPAELTSSIAKMSYVFRELLRFLMQIF